MATNWECHATPHPVRGSQGSLNAFWWHHIIVGRPCSTWTTLRMSKLWQWSMMKKRSQISVQNNAENNSWWPKREWHSSGMDDTLQVKLVEYYMIITYWLLRFTIWHYDMDGIVDMIWISEYFFHWHRLLSCISKSESAKSICIASGCIALLRWGPCHYIPCLLLGTHTL